MALFSREFLDVQGFDILVSLDLNRDRRKVLTIQIRQTGTTNYRPLVEADLLLADSYRELQTATQPEPEPDPA